MLRRALALTLAMPLALLGPGTGRADSVRNREQWVLDALSVSQAWRSTKGAGVTVAVLDTGVDASHPDIAGSITTGPDYIRRVAPHPGRIHGTWMSSLIAGHGHGSDDGIMGVAPKARVLSVRVISDPTEPGYRSFRHKPEYQSSLPKAIRYAADHGADVINMSLGGTDASTDERAAVAYAISKSVVVVASAGNDGGLKSQKKNASTRFSFPAAFPGVIAVAAVTRGGTRAEFSDHNESVLVAAPGVNVVGAGPRGTYWIGEGTSQSSALVSGVAALIRSKYPRMEPALVAQAITRSARGRPAAGYDESVGFGRVNAATALTEAGTLAGYRVSAPGRTGRFAEGPVGPVQVERHPPGLVLLGGWVGVAALFGFAGAMVITVLYVQRLRARSRAG
jgi:type VII secretion-associated serine protease mycosin